MNDRLCQFAFAGVIGASLALTGCATVIHGTTQDVEILTKPPGATARVLPENLAITTPGTISLERRKAHTVRVELAGYCRETAYIDRVVSDAELGNLVLGGLIGMLVDSSNGAAFVLQPDPVDLTLRPVPAATGDDSSGGCDQETRPPP